MSSLFSGDASPVAQGKSRARMSHEMLRAVATVQEQAKYLSFPDASVKTSESPLPLPVYVPETPALLIVHSQNDTFVDPEGSIIVGATVHAKLQGNSEIVEVRRFSSFSFHDTLLPSCVHHGACSCYFFSLGSFSVSHCARVYLHIPGEREGEP